MADRACPIQLIKQEESLNACEHERVSARLCLCTLRLVVLGVVDRHNFRVDDLQRESEQA